MLGPRDIKQLHGEIKASIPGLILTILLINTDVGRWVVGGGGAIFPRSLWLVLSSRSTCLSNLSFSHIVFFFLHPLSVCFSTSHPPHHHTPPTPPPTPLVFHHSLSLCTFFILSCVSLDQTGEALHALPFFIYSISVTVKKKIATLGAVGALLCSWKVK